jgi:transcriptional regulator with XRE-family HTH domain
MRKRLPTSLFSLRQRVFAASWSRLRLGAMAQISQITSQLPRATLDPSRESADAVLAKNLVTARVAAGMTQRALAEASGISRATIAQIEAGYSDPRLSTISELAKAMELPAIFLLIGQPEVRAMAQVLKRGEADQPSIDPRDVARMRQYIGSGMLKDRLRAALIGAKVARSISESEQARISAAIFSAHLPGTGTEIGALLGELLAQSDSRPGKVEAPVKSAKEKA